MFSIFKKPTVEWVATINNQAVVVKKGETVLQAALREHVDFPHGCRVGACTSCKCKLVAGSVRELTDMSYVLDDEDVAQGMILACQAVPTSDIQIRIEGPTQLAAPVSARVIGQQLLTHDITELKVQLQDSLIYKAGQFAELELESLPGVQRQYSFASAPHSNGIVSFFVRYVQGGTFSGAIQHNNVVGQRLWVRGPFGEFYLRAGTEPLLLIAGGSGLAPILAMLEQAQATQNRRAVTLIFGARTQQDLYAQTRIQAIRQRWLGDFNVVQILSHEPSNSLWPGARGFIAEHIPQYVQASMHAYLCGPELMIDSVEPKLKAAGIAVSNIRSDRFLTQAYTAAKF